jgi:AbrB family looped-hinge helix DNA binding protein
MVEEVTKMDRAGRVVIPKSIRKRAGLKGDSTLLVAEVSEGLIVLKKIDIESLAKALRKELKGVDVEAIAKKVEEEAS